VKSAIGEVAGLLPNRRPSIAHARFAFGPQLHALCVRHQRGGQFAVADLLRRRLLARFRRSIRIPSHAHPRSHREPGSPAGVVILLAGLGQRPPSLSPLPVACTTPLAPSATPFPTAFVPVTVRGRCLASPSPPRRFLHAAFTRARACGVDRLRRHASLFFRISAARRAAPGPAPALNILIESCFHPALELS